MDVIRAKPDACTVQQEVLVLVLEYELALLERSGKVSQKIVEPRLKKCVKICRM